MPLFKRRADQGGTIRDRYEFRDVLGTGAFSKVGDVPLLSLFHCSEFFLHSSIFGHLISFHASNQLLSLFSPSHLAGLQSAAATGSRLAWL